MADILIAPLGESPGVITMLVEWMQKDMLIPVDEVRVFYPLGYNDIIARGVEEILAPEFGKVQWPWGTVDNPNAHFPDTTLVPHLIEFAPGPAEDIVTERHVEELWKKFEEELVEAYDGGRNNVYLNITGGRKGITYALILAHLKVLERVAIKDVYHLVLLDPDLTRYSFRYLLICNEQTIKRYLYPPREFIRPLRLAFMVRPEVFRVPRGERGSEDVEGSELWVT
jgi:hypothetical protein